MSACDDKFGNCTLPNASDDGAPIQCVGEWVEEKHDYVRRYVEASYAARRKYLGTDKGGAAFIDLFAGPGRARIRENGKRIAGSPFLALDHARAPFTKVITCDLAQPNVDALRTRTAAHADRMETLHGDCNAIVNTIMSHVPRYGLNFAFIDPYAPSALAFSTITALAAAKRMDFVIHFPTGSIKRNFHNFLEDPTVLDRLLGTSKWDTHVRHASEAHLLLEVLRDQLASLGYTGETVRMIPVENGKHALMYHLVFASKDPLGDKLWQSITATTPYGQRSLFAE